MKSDILKIMVIIFIILFLIYLFFQSKENYSRQVTIISTDSLNGKVVLVTGGAKRIGKAIVEYLHSNGASVMIHYNTSKNKAIILKQQLNAIRPNSAEIIQCDLLINCYSELIKTTINRFGRLDALINNASSFIKTPMGEINQNDFNDLIGTNMKAPLFLSQEASKYLEQTEGSIINITDIHTLIPLSNYTVYNMAKAGLDGLTKSLAKELSPNIRVNSIAPGTIAWPEDNLSLTDKAKKAIEQNSLLKRNGRADEIASLVHYLITKGTYITGQVINVDGGRGINERNS